MVVLDKLFFIWETKKVVADRVKQVVVLFSNDCMGIHWGIHSALVVLDEWSYRGGRLNRFGCNASKVVSATFLVACFLSLEESTCQTSKNIFYFTSFRSQEN